MARTTDEGAMAPVAVLVKFSDGRVACAPVREEMGKRFDASMRPQLGFVVSPSDEVSPWLAEVIEYALNEGPDDMEADSLEAGDDLPACAWSLQRMP